MREANNFNEPYAYAKIKGGPNNQSLEGVMYLYPFHDGTIVEVEVINLPKDNNQVHGLHIHEGNICENDFKSAGEHYNPTNKPHPMHVGDLPPLFSNDGYGYLTTYTNRFKPEDIIGRTVIVHGGSDDFKSQPSGDSGPRIACGVIEKMNKTL
jgi:Cu-Zn family superoxide dismutase